jgi:hypothetical protein
LLSRQTLLRDLDQFLHVNVLTQPSTCFQLITHNYPLMCFMAHLRQLRSMWWSKLPY